VTTARAHLSGIVQCYDSRLTRSLSWRQRAGPLDNIRTLTVNETDRNAMEKPPWSGQPVRRWVRVLAWIFVILALMAGLIGMVLLLHGTGIAKEQLPMALLFLFGEIYFVAVLLHVIIKGTAPSSWLPWR